MLKSRKVFKGLAVGVGAASVMGAGAGSAMAQPVQKHCPGDAVKQAQDSSQQSSSQSHQNFSPTGNIALANYGKTSQSGNHAYNRSSNSSEQSQQSGANDGAVGRPGVVWNHDAQSFREVRRGSGPQGVHQDQDNSQRSEAESHQSASPTLNVAALNFGKTSQSGNHASNHSSNRSNQSQSAGQGVQRPDGMQTLRRADGPQGVSQDQDNYQRSEAESHQNFSPTLNVAALNFGKTSQSGNHAYNSSSNQSDQHQNAGGQQPVL